MDTFSFVLLFICFIAASVFLLRAVRKKISRLQKVAGVVLIIALSAFLIMLQLGYKIPHFDKHKSWHTLDSYTDKQMVIEKKINRVKNVFNIEGTENFIVVSIVGEEDGGGNLVTVITSRGNVVNQVKVSQAQGLPFIDAYFKRVITSTNEQDSLGNNSYTYTAIDLNALTSKPLPVKKLYASESFDQYIKRIGKDKDALTDEAIKEKYRQSQSVYIDFIKKLKPVMLILENSTRAALWSDKQGNVYDLEHDGENLDILYPEWSYGYIKEILSTFTDQNFTVTDSNYIIGNYLEKKLDGAGWFVFPVIRFKQYYMNYFSIKLYRESLNIKDSSTIPYKDKPIEATVIKSDTKGQTAESRNEEVFVYVSSIKCTCF